MCYFNFLTGKAYKANSDIANILSDYCKKNAIAEGNKAEDFDQEVPFCDHAYGTLTPEQVEELSADVDQFCPF